MAHPGPLLHCLVAVLECMLQNPVRSFLHLIQSLQQAKKPADKLLCGGVPAHALIMCCTLPRDRSQRIEAVEPGRNSAAVRKSCLQLPIRNSHRVAICQQQVQILVGGSSSSSTFTSLTPVSTECRTLLTALTAREASLLARPARPPWWQR